MKVLGMVGFLGSFEGFVDGICKGSSTKSRFRFLVVLRGL